MIDCLYYLWKFVFYNKILLIIHCVTTVIFVKPICLFINVDCTWWYGRGNTFFFVVFFFLSETLGIDGYLLNIQSVYTRCIRGAHFCFYLWVSNLIYASIKMKLIIPSTLIIYFFIGKLNTPPINVMQL